MDLELQDYRVIVTGGASGIGAAIAAAFIGEGASVAVVDRDESTMAALADSVRGGPGSFVAVAADLSTLDGCNAGIARAIEALGGGVDTLVNNVGAGAVRTFDQLTDEDWQQTMNLNFMSYVRTTRAALPALRQSTRMASIINNASDLAKQPEAVPVDYSASKAAVLSLTKGLARAEGPGLRVNAVAPGPVWTPFWTQPGGFAETMGAFHNMEPQAAVEHELSLRQLPMGRLGQPEEVADVVLFLASARASFVTSSVWDVGGGSIRSLY